VRISRVRLCDGQLAVLIIRGGPTVIRRILLYSLDSHAALALVLVFRSPIEALTYKLQCIAVFPGVLGRKYWERF